MTSFIPSITLPGFIFEQPAASILLPVLLGSGVGFAMQPKETQKTHLALKQPPYRPPPQIFGIMWPILYGLMGFSAYRAWTTGMNTFDAHKTQLAKVRHTAYPNSATLLTGWREQQGATLYTIQLGLNLIWMPLFFKYQRPIEATVDIVALTGVTGYLTYIWGQVDEVAGWALAPYLGWLCFATYLSAGAGYLNDWDFAGKERPAATKTHNTKYVDEKDA
ncbi:hypothetical protein LTR16_004053 [Cryomyces antarcticus]|uniref:TspO/MBR-related protein n=1 Tax=Cryomyces antarcticus TaxID=329879 RepID=A0ABR0M6E8_9PEZI|nr:hypothetical protein LTR16_004053 [Cryomyces antarcticus]